MTKKNNGLVFCSDCPNFIMSGECMEGHDIDEITPSICEDGVDKEAYKQRKFSFKLNTTIEGAKGVIKDLRTFMEQQNNAWAFDELSFENL